MSINSSYILAVNTELGDADELALVRETFADARPLGGCYKGETERSYCVSLDANYNDVFNMARAFNQVCFLVVTNRGCASLRYIDPNRYELIGQVKQVSKEQTKGLDYTYDPADETYYIVEGK